MSDPQTRLDSSLDAEQVRASARSIETWIRLRITIFSAIMVLGVWLVLDFVLVYVLPIPPAMAVLVRADILIFAPASMATTSTPSATRSTPRVPARLRSVARCRVRRRPPLTASVPRWTR